MYLIKNRTGPRNSGPSYSGKVGWETERRRGSRKDEECELILKGVWAVSWGVERSKLMVV